MLTAALLLAAITATPECGGWRIDEKTMITYCTEDGEQRSALIGPSANRVMLFVGECPPGFTELKVVPLVSITGGPPIKFCKVE